MGDDLGHPEFGAAARPGKHCLSTISSTDTVLLRFSLMATNLPWYRPITSIGGCGNNARQPPMIASRLKLSPCAVSVLGQLFVEGPTSDDSITSKAGRCDLVSAGLAFHEAGWSSLTPDGARLAREWDLCSLYARRDRRWYLKVRTNTCPDDAAISRSDSSAAAAR